MTLTQDDAPKYDDLIKSIVSVCGLLFLTAIGDTYSQDRPHVIENAWSPSPMAGKEDVNPVTPFRVNFSTPIDPASLSTATYQLVGPDGSSVEATVNTDLTGGVATLTPTGPLRPDTEYTLIVTEDLLSEDGELFVRYETSYRTGSQTVEVLPGFRFTGSMIADRESNSSIIVGPDGHLYVSDTFGEIIRYHLDPDERPILDEDGNPMLFSPRSTLPSTPRPVPSTWLISGNGSGRQLVGKVRCGFWSPWSSNSFGVRRISTLFREASEVESASLFLFYRQLQPDCP